MNNQRAGDQSQSQQHGKNPGPKEPFHPELHSKQQKELNENGAEPAKGATDPGQQEDSQAPGPVDREDISQAIIRHHPAVKGRGGHAQTKNTENVTHKGVIGRRLFHGIFGGEKVKKEARAGTYRIGDVRYEGTHPRDKEQTGQDPRPLDGNPLGGEGKVTGHGRHNVIVTLATIGLGAECLRPKSPTHHSRGQDNNEQKQQRLCQGGDLAQFPVGIHATVHDGEKQAATGHQHPEIRPTGQEEGVDGGIPG